MKKMITTALFLMCLIMNATNPMGFVIPKEFKTETTFSGHISEEKSFHLIFAKHKKTKQFKVFSYVFDGEKISELPSLINKTSLSVVSFHKNKENLTLLLSFKKKRNFFLKRIEYDLKSFIKKEFEELEHEGFLTSIRKENESILVFKDKEVFTIKIFKEKGEFTKKELLLRESKKLKNFFGDERVSAVKIDEFVHNGSTSKIRVYHIDDKLVFTKESERELIINIGNKSLSNNKKNVTEVLSLDLKSSKLDPRFKKFYYGEENKIKKATSFFNEDILFQLALSRKEGFVNLSNINTGESFKTLVFSSDIKKYIRGNKAFKGIDDFLKNAGKSKFNPTITANRTKDNKLRLRFDYVDVTYSYNYNFWHHDQFMWFMQQNQQNMIQQQIRNLPSGFGPSIQEDFLNSIYKTKKRDRFFEVLIDFQGNLLDENLTETIHKYIDKDAFIKHLDENLIYKFDSSCFLENSFRYIGYNIESRRFEIVTEELE